MSDGNEEREEVKARLERAKLENREDTYEPNPYDDWAPERPES